MAKSIKFLLLRYHRAIFKLSAFGNYNNTKSFASSMSFFNYITNFIYINRNFRD